MPRASTSAAVLAFATIAAAPAFGQFSQNASLLSKLDTYGGYNDVWGYAANGVELCILGTTTGTSFIDATDPTNPIEVKFISGPFSTWRDMDTWGTYAYMGSEGGGGIQIVDLTDPLDPILVKSWGQPSITSSHTIYVDKTAGHLYVNGATTGMWIADLADPLNPAIITNYGSNYVHDSFAQNGMAHLAEIYGGRYRIVDASGLPSFVSLDSVNTPGSFTHNVWVSADDRIAGTTDESSNGHLALYDISNPNNVNKLSEFTTGTGSIIHNTYLEGNVAHCAWYTDGYVAVDIQDPVNPTLLAYYDTYKPPASGYTGAWACYPYQPSGVVYVNDTATGLYIVEIDCLPAAFYGSGLAGTGGYTPSIDETGGLANAGNGGYGIVAEGLLGGAPGAFFVGTASGSVPAFGGTILVDLFQPILVLPFVAGGAGAGAGTASTPFPLPNNPALVGLKLFGQALALDAGAPSGVSMTGGLEITICDPV
jgi:choice-of-anchor B domain-containing protein